MLPRKLHLEQVNRFHDKIEELDKLIDTTTDKEQRFKLLSQYHFLVKDVWTKLDDSIEEVKFSLDTVR